MAILSAKADLHQTKIQPIFSGITKRSPSGSDAAALKTRAVWDATRRVWVLNGGKRFITNGGKADFYNLFARTSDDGSRGVSCLLVDKDTEGLSFGKPEEKMGLRAVPTASANYDDAFISEERLIGQRGQGLPIAFSALDSGRLGIAAVAVGIAQGALDNAVVMAKVLTERGLRVVSGRTIAPLLDYWGDTPVPPAPALTVALASETV